MIAHETFEKIITPALAIFGAIFGLAGTIFGLINLRLTYKTHKVKIEIKPMRASCVTHGDAGVISKVEIVDLGIEVYNHSYFDVTVVEFGLVVRDAKDGKRSDFPIWKENYRISARDMKVLSKRYNHGDFNKMFTEAYVNKICNAEKGYIRLATGQRFQGYDKRLDSFKEFFKLMAKQQNIIS
jgi:hypothetical protein